MDSEACINTAVAVAQAARRTQPWAVCNACVRRLAECPGMNLSMTGKADRTRQALRLGFYDDEEEAESFRIHDTSLSVVRWGELMAAAGEGCALCTAVCERVLDGLRSPSQSQMEFMRWEAVPGGDNRKLAGRLFKGDFEDVGSLLESLTLTFDRAHNQGSFKLMMTPLYRPGVPDAQKVPYFETLEWGLFAVHAKDNDHLVETIQSYRPNLDVGGDAAFSQAVTWVDRCRQDCDHDHSGDSRIPVARPGRLVDVAPQDSSSDHDIALVPGNQPGLGEYIALSYCWGQREQPMATTTTNLRDRMERGFSLSDMPETIRDAILVTRRLGFRCLWVDSLCILQDFRADKKAEIKKMAGIFEGAFLTIVAASASVVTQGFLSPQHVELPREINSIPVWNHDGRVGRALLQEPGLVRSEPDPIHYRAWTFEELLLSPRRLVYSGRQLIWTCRGFQAQDGGWDDREFFYLDSELDPYRFYQGLPQEPFEMEQDDDSDHAPPFPMAFKDYWAAVLRQYTARTLTHPQDRLVAVQGIVSRLSDITGHQYEAGIWKDYPISSFCWHYDSQGGNEDDLAPANNKVTIPETRDQAIECPTWSWGSVTDPVCLPDEPFTESWEAEPDKLAEFLDIVPSKTTEGSRLVMLRASCLNVQGVELIDFATTCAEREEQDLKYFPPVDGHISCKTAQEYGGVNCLELDLLIWPDTQQIWRLAPERLRFVCLRYFDGILRGLILTSIRETDRYERIGYFEAVVRENEDDSDEDMITVDEASQEAAGRIPREILGPQETLLIE